MKKYYLSKTNSFVGLDDGGKPKIYPNSNIEKCSYFDRKEDAEAFLAKCKKVFKMKKWVISSLDIFDSSENSGLLRYVVFKGDSISVNVNGKYKVFDKKMAIDNYYKTEEEASNALKKAKLSKWDIGIATVSKDNKVVIQKLIDFDKEEIIGYVIYKGSDILNRKGTKEKPSVNKKYAESNHFHTFKEAADFRDALIAKKALNSGWEIGIAINSPNGVVSIEKGNVADIVESEKVDENNSVADDEIYNYIITNGSSWIKKNNNGEFVDTFEPLEAFVFKTKMEASDAVKLYGKPGYSFTHIDKDASKTKDDDKSICQKAVEKEIEKIIHVNSGNKVCDIVDGELNKIDDILNNLQSMNIQYKNELENIEKYLCDYYHFVEFYDFKEGEWEKSLRVLKAVLLHRRDLKDSMGKIEATTGLHEDVKSTKASFLKMQSRTYCPRISNELFLGESEKIKVSGAKKHEVSIVDTLFNFFKTRTLLIR